MLSCLILNQTYTYVPPKYMNVIVQLIEDVSYCFADTAELQNERDAFNQAHTSKPLSMLLNSDKCCCTSSELQPSLIPIVSAGRR